MKDSILLDHIQESILSILSYCEGLEYEDLLEDQKSQDAIIRRLEIIGEAVKNLSDECKAKSPSTPWKRIAGFRDILIHKYFAIDTKLLWGIIQKQLPEFEETVKQLKK